MEQVTAELKRFPGFSIVYPDNKSGLRVIHTYKQGAARTYNPDGTVSWSTPPPTIYELFPMGKGGFTYEDGRVVNNRKHLETIADDKFRERALRWFDNSRRVSEEAIGPSKPNPDELKRPETVYAVSTDLPREDGIITKEELSEESPKAQPVPAEKSFQTEVMSALSTIMDRLDKQDKEITQIKKSPPPPRRMAKSIAKHSKQSDTMKTKWADPDFRAKMLAKNPAIQKKETNGENTSETSEEMQAV